MEEHILRKLDNGSDVLPLVREQKDPKISFEKQLTQRAIDRRQKE